MWLMLCLTSASGRLLNVSIAINRPIVIACCAYCLFLISLYFCFRFCYCIFLYVFFSFDVTILVNKDVHIMADKLTERSPSSSFDTLKKICWKIFFQKLQVAGMWCYDSTIESLLMHPNSWNVTLFAFCNTTDIKISATDEWNAIY